MTFLNLLNSFQLDDDQVPSETKVIKWVQDHVTNDDLNRIQTLREIRKCFARTSTSGTHFILTFMYLIYISTYPHFFLVSDIDDGCEFSKELTMCLNVDIE